VDLTPAGLKTEHERILDEMLEFERSTYMQLNMAYYNMGLKIGEYQGRLKALDELIEALEKQENHEPELPHADSIPCDIGRGDDQCASG
jgi:hypothetical protein